MKMTNLIILTSIFLIGICCSKENSEKNQTINNKLIGEWIEISPCDLCNTLTFSDNDTIYQKSKWDKTSLRLFYQLLTEDSVKVIRNWEIEPKNKTTNHKIVFYSNDTIVIKQFMAVDFGITGFEDIKLYKTIKP